MRVQLPGSVRTTQSGVGFMGGQGMRLWGSRHGEVKGVGMVGVKGVGVLG